MSLASMGGTFKCAQRQVLKPISFSLLSFDFGPYISRSSLGTIDFSPLLIYVTRSRNILSGFMYIEEI